MTALITERATRRRHMHVGGRRSLPVATGVRCLTGGIAVRNSGGYVQPGETATGLVAVGVFDDTTNNVGGANGNVRADVRNDGVFCFDSAGGADAITFDDIGATCYVVDDQTVALTNGTGTRSVAGKIHDVDAAGVWVVFELGL